MWLVTILLDSAARLFLSWIDTFGRMTVERAVPLDVFLDVDGVVGFWNTGTS